MSASNSKTKEMICISCPLGCRLSVGEDQDGAIVVKGNKCARGTVYGQEEYLAPKRMVTCTCRTDCEKFPRLPVRTSEAIAIELIPDLLRELYAMTLPLPVKRGQRVLQNYRDSGIDVIATLTLADHATHAAKR
ncbi:MAG: DUF1667 domain-containing protein [Spirochaetaceae bacterium]|nr:MAG: DUF1667 domain-containing protein [Spirochaetaceae bacterium]